MHRKCSLSWCDGHLQYSKKSWRQHTSSGIGFCLLSRWSFARCTAAERIIVEMSFALTPSSVNFKTYSCCSIAVESQLEDFERFFFWLIAYTSSFFVVIENSTRTFLISPRCRFVCWRSIICVREDKIVVLLFPVDRKFHLVLIWSMFSQHFSPFSISLYRVSWCYYAVVLVRRSKNNDTRNRIKIHFFSRRLKVKDTGTSSQ